jgi:hypothetical protein
MQAAARTGLSVTPEQFWPYKVMPSDKFLRMLWVELLGEKHPELSEYVDISYTEFCSILEDHYLEHDIFPTEGCLEIFEYLKSQDIKDCINNRFL